MKVSQTKGFNPITIVLESKNEARLLWAVLNIPFAFIQRQNEPDFKVDGGLSDVHQKMFDRFDDIFCARKEY
jgi:hypothetical protein